MRAEIEDEIGLDASEAPLTSAKLGIGIDDVLEAVVTRSPPPGGDANARLRALGLRGRDGSVLDVTTQKGANAAMDVLDKALERALDQETTVGAMSSRLDYTISNLTVQSENLTDAKSTLLDADMAKEMLAYTRENVLMQAAMAMLAQNNKNAGWFLSLLG